MTAKTVRLPQDIDSFSERTMLMCLEGDSAKVYLGEGDTVTEQNSISTSATKFKYSDKEGFNSHGGSVFTSGGENHDKEHYRQVFLNHLAKEMHRLFQKGKFDRLAVFVPQDMKNMVQEKIPHDILQKTRIISGNMAKHTPLDLVRRMFLQ